MPKYWSYDIDTLVIPNDKAPLEQRRDKPGLITEHHEGLQYDYVVQFGKDDEMRFKEEELDFVDFKVGDDVEYFEEDAKVVQVDFKHLQAEIAFNDNSMDVVDLNQIKLISKQGEGKLSHKEKEVEFNFEEKGTEIGKLVNEKQKAYGDSVSKAFKLMQVYLENYDNGDGTYTIPKSLLQHILLQVRIIDKQNRIFNNPEGDLMAENPYADTVGYGLLGMRMADELESNKQCT